MAQDPKETLAELQDMDKMLADHDAGDEKAVEAALKAMKKAMDNESEDEIQLAGDLVEEAIAKVDKSLHACQLLHRGVDELQQDKEFLGQHRAVVVKIVQHFGPKQKQLGQWAAALRKLQEDARKAESAAKKSTGEVESELGEVKNLADKVGFRLGNYVKESKRIEKTALDQPTSKAAEKARLDLIDLNRSLQEGNRELKIRIDAFRKNHDDVDKSLKAELQDAADLLERGTDAQKDGEALLLKLLKARQQTAADDAQRPKVVELSDGDLKKLVVPIVGIDPKDGKAIAELSKLMRETPTEKWGDALGKLASKLKLKNANGKAMAQQIEKLPAVKKLVAMG